MCVYMESEIYGDDGEGMQVRIKEHLFAFVITVIATAVMVYFILNMPKERLSERNDSFYSEEESFNDSLNDYDYNRLNEI